MTSTRHLFECYGVELEYMLVHRKTLAILPMADQVLKSVSGTYDSEVPRNGLSWSNELVLHVIELKTNGPAASLDGLAALFQADVRHINDLAIRFDGQLMPTAVHPWMDPLKEMRLWPHEYSPVYEAFNRIFGCRGHGWANLQSTHLNLPFCGDEEFARLHAAIRLLLPIMPALTASSPILDGRVSGLLDARLEAYRHNARRIPAVTGHIVPEDVSSADEYARHILQPLYREIAPHDSDGILQYEWLNARGAIARFDRGAIEIRVLDIQECPQADLAILQLIAAALQTLVQETWCPLSAQRAWDTAALRDILLDTIRDADQTVLRNADYARMFGLAPQKGLTVGALWRGIAGFSFKNAGFSTETESTLRFLLDHGCLARRIVAATGPAPDRARLREVYRALCNCLAAGTMFHESC